MAGFKSLSTRSHAVQGVQFQPVQIDLADKPAWYRRVAPSGLVPALSYGGSVITESINICRWVDAELEGPPLVPADTARRREMDALISLAARVNSAGLDLLSGQGARCAVKGGRMRGCCMRRPAGCFVPWRAHALQVLGHWARAVGRAAQGV